jgi:ribose transport system substrate-binding protein
MLPLAVAAAVMVTATGASSTSAAPKKIHIAVFLASAANSYWAASLQGAKDIATEYGNVDLTVFDGGFNTTTQLNQLRDALVSKKFDAWYVGPNAGEPLVPTIDKAIKQGVKVACTLVPCGPIDKPVAGPGQVAFIGIPMYENGQQLGQLVAQGCAGIANCKVAWLPGLPEAPLEKLRTEGLYSIISKDKNIHVVATQAGGYLAAPSQTAMQNILQAHPDLNAVAGSGDQEIAGAVKAAQLAGKKAGQIKFYGDGCTIEAKALILQGWETGCAVYNPRTEGRMATTLLVLAVEGQKIVDNTINPLVMSPIGAVGTKANIAKFTPEFHS